MAKHFLSVVEFIKNRNFEVNVPAFYHPNLPEGMTNSKPAPLERINRWKPVAINRRNPLPFRHIEDPDQIQRACYSIEIMLDMFRKKVEFEIVDKHDIPEIFDGLDRYLVSLRPDVEMGNERVIEYARLVISWREEVYKHYYRYMKEHPAALEKLFPNNDPTNNLMTLMSKTSGIRGELKNLDPLRAKAEPPYRIDKILPTNPDSAAATVDEFESSLGLSSASGALSDDGKDFDFEDFLRKG